MADDGPEGASDVEELRSENERLRAELAEMKDSLRVSVPARGSKKRPEVTDEPEPERAYVLVADYAGRPAERMRALTRVAVEAAAAAMPDFTWSSIDDASGLPVGTLVLFEPYVVVRVFGGRKETGVPMYEVDESGELRRIFNGEFGGEAFEAIFMMEHRAEFYERDSENPATHEAIREAYRLSGNLTRASLAAVRARWENGEDEGDSSWRAGYEQWQASEQRLMDWFATNADENRR